ncbi:MAG: cbb3-type cytochrome c oxidase subunit 3 [Gemmatimonadetes bacterium]|nr:cbb3-type cytochrome c oxidase subunit 3 [Gemmatimonadota bacterium]MBK9406638.1 cbb3-type cytochrome c oxidase subunit 3 [Gemmatimonadota bacterium]MBK9979614.1 cbb3-type cytochrome c oxidase subunit 3 [Gemmatimonadota bacterium]
MSLTELMSGANLDGYAQISLILFLVAFGLVLWRIFSPRFNETYQKAARMPLDDETPQTPRKRGE